MDQIEVVPKTGVDQKHEGEEMKHNPKKKAERQSTQRDNEPSDESAEVLSEANSQNQSTPREDCSKAWCRVLKATANASRGSPKVSKAMYDVQNCPSPQFKVFTI